MNKITTEEFIRRGKKIHGDKYDYSKTEYINYDEKLKIICPKHGEFWQTPGNHLKGKGCPFCSGNAKLTTEEFIRRAKKIHGDKYDYSKTKYVNYNTKVCLINEEGKEFWQTPSNHLYGYDCTKNKMTEEEFILKARQIHGWKYDYSKINYTNTKTKICVICPEHGEFWQTPNAHLKGQGCPKCAIEKIHKKQKYATEDFIKKAIEKHGNKYDYSKVEYINNSTKVCIICPEHGEFWQNPYSHLKGCKCLKCDKHKQLTTEDFIERANKIHPEYNYSKINYINNHTKVSIICPVHGEFKISPNNFFRGEGCKECGRNFRKEETKLYKALKNFFKEEEIIHSYYNKDILKKQEIDIYFPKQKIGVEYQGKQHFQPVDFAGYGYERAEKIFYENCERDIKKLKICKNNNIKLFYFSKINEENTFLGEKVYHNYEEIINVINQIIKKESEK